jgi:putative peptidoglycan lipid II flippase
MTKSPTPSPVGDSFTPTGNANVGRGIAIAALLIAVGNIASRVIGQGRESLIAYLFGVSPDVGAFAIASRVPTTLYDLIVGGLVSAALVPIFSELAERDDGQLGHVAGTVFTIATLLMAFAAGVVWLFAPLLGLLYAAPSRDLIVELIRWMLPAVVFMGLGGLITGLLQARRKFLLPAFSTTVFNLGIIVGAVVLSGVLGVRSLAVGMLLGGIGQVVLQAPGMRGVGLRPNLDLGNPHVRRLGRLYLPVIVGIGFSVIGTQIDSVLVSGLAGGAAAAIQRYATTLIQLALGIVATAISLAALPTLARQGIDDGDLGAYRRTLALSIKALLLLLLPMTALLAALAYPVCSLLFGWGEGGNSTALIATGLLVYLPSLIAAGIDQPLIMAFYARRNTLLPNLVQGIAIAAYTVVALLTVGSLGVYGLILGNVVQWWVHALVMLYFAHTRLDALRDQRLGEAAWKGLLASGTAGLISFGAYQVTGGLADGKFGDGVTIAVFGALGIVVYVIAAVLLRIEALAVFGSVIGRRLRR